VSKTTKKQAPRAPKTHHLDRRAANIAAANFGRDDELMTTEQIAEWFGVSIQWLEIGRLRGYGPPYERIAPRVIRYRRSKVKQWLDGRTHSSTSEYRDNPRRIERVGA
jgi:hypothetical protein